MTVTAYVAVGEELDPQHAEIITATLPLVGAHIDEITKVFYSRMFAARPELLRNLFNRGNQAQGAQQRALAASIATYATHLVDPKLPHPAELLSRIGHKHASLGITADQYEIVHEHLFAAIVEVLGADTVTAEVAGAWDAVYWMMARTLIELERNLYAEAGVDDGDVYRRASVVAREDDPSGAVLLTVRSTGRPFATFRPGQYVSVGVTLPDGARQLRQYSLINTPADGDLTFAVRPLGEVSNWIRANVQAGDVLDVTVPFGDLPDPEAHHRPLVLVSAGIGITPMVGILEHLAAVAPATSVTVWHADRSAVTHPLKDRQRELVAALPDATLEVWYEEADADAREGLLDVSAVELPDHAEVYLCGGNGFVQAVRAQLQERGVPNERLHCELFSPNDWLLA
ncbi:globin domain-containing protein [Mycolicibacterium monacense]|uniref:nitric oxide dioxygenase n=1 Tax=Mycolicibacterium monacense TaxID=85693 RepID=A0AAD1IWX1_MYCMB|nr:globin domain-containing protein [Mycolicibacterium monacense]MDA4100503.1 hemin transporter [Mycolicibacterium monacense DSM 44395]ORB21442.1 hemin transporter [Mycolicibacterium monacense DSM 44395]QHP84762.1 hemin transporter [Mycolicibacterium monacense DSM 44395]BBZ62434.1 hemin transporter [Mycolicibacterium monacense]